MLEQSATAAVCGRLIAVGRRRWGAVTDGLILLGVLAVLFAIGVAWGRKRLGMRFSGRGFAIAVSGFAIAVLVLWVSQRH
jgi:hypothetical protein